MPCYHPLRGWILGTKPNGKYILQITPMEQEQLEVNGEVRFYDSDNSILIPCGKCSGCRMDKAREWANRILLESKCYPEGDSWFITLTYDEEHLEKRCLNKSFIDPVTGQFFPDNFSIRKKELQDFMKRLRDRYGYKSLRFFGIGEYGSFSARPHYHLIVFGLHLPVSDLCFYKNSELHNPYYNSDLISKCWPFGFSVLAPVTWESACYVARYTFKKLDGEYQIYEDNNMQPPFALMSRKPGIAKPYYDLHPEILNKDKIIVSTDKGSKQFPPPRYLESLFEIDDPETWRIRHDTKKRVALARTDLTLQRTDLSHKKYLEVLEKNFDKARSVLAQYRSKV